MRYTAGQEDESPGDVFGNGWPLDQEIQMLADVNTDRRRQFKPTDNLGALAPDAHALGRGAFRLYDDSSSDLELTSSSESDVFASDTIF